MSKINNGCEEDQRFYSHDSKKVSKPCCDIDEEYVHDPKKT